MKLETLEAKVVSSKHLIQVLTWGLILGVETCDTHEWRKTKNGKKPLRSQHNSAKQNNS